MQDRSDARSAGWGMDAAPELSNMAFSSPCSCVVVVVVEKLRVPFSGGYLGHCPRIFPSSVLTLTRYCSGPRVTGTGESETLQLVENTIAEPYFNGCVEARCPGLIIGRKMLREEGINGVALPMAPAAICS
eukprot:1183916-Prorocentrum_minimum.AAC.1